MSVKLSAHPPQLEELLLDDELLPLEEGGTCGGSVEDADAEACNATSKRSQAMMLTDSKHTQRQQCCAGPT